MEENEDKFLYGDSQSYNSSNCGKQTNIDDYQKMKKIGKGSYGTLYKAQHKTSKVLFAVKKIAFDGLRSLDREDKLLMHLNHVNVIKLHAVARTQNPENKFLVLELCETDLKKILDNQNHPLSEPEIKCIMKQLLNGLCYLHGNSIIHRDINVSNLLLNEDGVLKISDFGSGTNGKSEIMLSPNIGTRWYIAPEVFFVHGSYTTAVDMWSAGCIFGELLKNVPLFPGTSDMDMISRFIDLLGTPNDKIMPGFSSLPLMQIFDLKQQPYCYIKKVFKGCSDNAIQLLKNLLLYNVRIRATAQCALKCSYFRVKPEAADPKDLMTHCLDSEQ